MRPLSILCGVWLAAPMLAAEPAIEKGHFRFTQAGEQTNVPERYRLDARGVETILTSGLRTSSSSPQSPSSGGLLACVPLFHEKVGCLLASLS
jgi:hypothetical protein